MDRQMVYPGSIPLDTDLLNIQRHVMKSLGTLARAIIGDGGLVTGMGCAAGSANYSVTVGPGSCSMIMPTDAVQYGSLTADLTPLMQTGMLVDAVTLQLTPPPGSNQVLCWLVQARLAQVDTGPVALPYWNAANPNMPFTGPGNSGVAQATQRLLRVEVAAKPGVPQPFPAGTPPEPDAGWLGLYAVTTFTGKPAIAAGDVVEVWHAPWLRYTLPQLPPGPSRQEVFTLDTVWRVPPRVRGVKVRVAGGGGGGGGGDVGYSGGGGGAGGYAEAFAAVRPGQLYSVVIGAGGTPGSTGVSGLPGGDTWFGNLVKASGGQGGGAHNPDSHGGGPGIGVVGSLLQGGGFGGDGAGIARIPGGNGGASAFGGGGRGADEGGAPANGIAAGSGGGGGYGTFSGGGLGANGLVVIEY